MLLSLCTWYIPTQTRSRSELTVAVLSSKIPRKSCSHDFGTDGKQGSAYGIYHVHNSEPADGVRNYSLKVSRCCEISFCNTGNGQYRQNKGDLPLLRSPFLSILNISVTCKNNFAITYLTGKRKEEKSCIRFYRWIT